MRAETAEDRVAHFPVCMRDFRWDSIAGPLEETVGIGLWWVGAERVLSEEERILGIGDSIRMALGWES